MVCNSRGFEVVKTLMQGLPLKVPIAVPATPSIAIHSSALSLSTCSMLLLGIGFSSFTVLDMLQQEQPVRLLAAAMLNIKIEISLTIDKSSSPAPKKSISGLAKRYGSPSIVTPKQSSIGMIRFAIAYFPLASPAKSKPTGCLPGSVTKSEPESPALINGLPDCTII